MSDELITIATYLDSIEANLARDELQAAGIPAFVVGDDVGSVLAMMTSSIGMKLRIYRKDLKAAQQVLRDIEALDDDHVPTEEVFANQTEDDEAAGDDADPLTQREQDADRAFRSAVIGFFFCPLQAYTIWLLSRVLFSEERLGPKQRRSALIASVIAVPYVLLALSVLKLLFFSE